MTPVSTPFSDPGEMPAGARAELDQIFRASRVGDLLGLRLLGWGSGHSRFLLEPNVKRSRGGLRDLAFIRWIGFVRYGEKILTA